MALHRSKCYNFKQMRMLGQYSQLGLNNFNGHFGQSYPNHGQSVQDTHQQGHVNDHDYGDNQHNKMVNHIKILNKIILEFIPNIYNLCDKNIKFF